MTRPDPFEHLKRYAADLETEVSAERARLQVSRAIAAGSSRPRPRRAVVALATTVFLGFSNVALAAVADPAVPGDALYGIDRAFERVGSIFGLDGINAVERFDEVSVLLQRGRAAEALELVQATLNQILDSPDPKAELEKIRGAHGDDFDDMLDSLLSLARGVELGKADDQAVSAAAKALVDTVQLPEQAKGSPGGPPDSTPTDSKPITPADTRPATRGSTPGATAPGRPNQGNSGGDS